MDLLSTVCGFAVDYKLMRQFPKEKNKKTTTTSLLPWCF